MKDWIDEEKDRRDCGIHRALSQADHEAVNARYEGCTKERCFICDEYTGGAGRGEDSIYFEDQGPYCPECWRKHPAYGTDY